MYLPVAVNGAEILDHGSIAEKIGFECGWNDRHSGGFRQLDADRIKVIHVKNSGAGSLREDHDGFAAFQSLFAFVDHGTEVVARILASDADAAERAHDVAEIRNLKKLFLDDKTEIFAGTDECVHHRRFQQAHVVADEQDRSFGPADVVESAQMKSAAAAFRDEDVVIRIPGLLILREPAFPAGASGTVENVKIPQIE